MPELGKDEANHVCRNNFAYHFEAVGMGTLVSVLVSI